MQVICFLTAHKRQLHFVDQYQKWQSCAVELGYMPQRFLFWFALKRARILSGAHAVVCKLLCYRWGEPNTTKHFVPIGKIEVQWHWCWALDDRKLRSTSYPCLWLIGTSQEECCHTNIIMHSHEQNFLNFVRAGVFLCKKKMYVCSSECMAIDTSGKTGWLY